MTPSEQYLTAKELAERWRNIVSPQALANWRSEGRGPAFVKIGGRVLYPIRDVLAYEQQSRRNAN